MIEYPKQVLPKEPVTQKNSKKKSRDEVKINYQYMREKDKEPVKGVFHFYECPGAPLRFSYKAYKGDDVEDYELFDGFQYTLPLGVAKHLNKSGQVPVYEYKEDDRGMPVVLVGKKRRRYGFQSLEFIDVDDFPNRISEEVNGVIEIKRL